MIRATMNIQKNEQGAALITALILLVLLTLLGLSTMSTTTMEEKMSANSQENNRAFQTAESGLEMVLNDDSAIDTSNTQELDGTADDKYDNTVTVGSGSYTATTRNNAVYLQKTLPRRGEGWDSTYAYYYFDLSAQGTTNSGSTATVHAGIYQVGKNN